MWQKFLAKLRKKSSTPAVCSAESQRVRRAQNAPEPAFDLGRPGLQMRCGAEEFAVKRSLHPTHREPLCGGGPGAQRLDQWDCTLGLHCW